MRSLLALTLLFAPFPLSGAAPVLALYAVLPGTSMLKYTIKHKLHEVTAEALKSPTELRASGMLRVSLEAYAIERPSLLLLPIEDACTVDLDLSLQKEK